MVLWNSNFSARILPLFWFDEFFKERNFQRFFTQPSTYRIFCNLYHCDEDCVNCIWNFAPKSLILCSSPQTACFYHNESAVSWRIWNSFLRKNCNFTSSFRLIAKAVDYLIAEKKDPFILFGNRPKCETKTTEKRTLQQHLQLNGLFIKWILYLSSPTEMTSTVEAFFVGKKYLLHEMHKMYLLFFQFSQFSEFSWFWIISKKFSWKSHVTNCLVLIG